MKPSVSLADEYKVLFDELRQNRLIQLQALASSPVWLGVVLALLGSRGEWPSGHAFLFLAPIPLLFVNVLLILDRRGSSDFIIGYIRLAVDKQLADRPGWNLLLPEFRTRFAALEAESRHGGIAIPQRFDFNVIVILSFLLMSLTCSALFLVASGRAVIFAVAVAVVGLSHAFAFAHIVKQANRKGNILLAWEATLVNRASPPESPESTPPVP